MRELTREHRAALEAVARRFSSTTWEARHAGRPGAWLTWEGKPVAVEIAAIDRQRALPQSRPHLRFDRVVLEVSRRLRTALEGLVPRGQAVMITLTAPILQPGRTTDAIVERVRGPLQHPSSRLEIDASLHGNRIRTRRVKDIPPGAPPVIVFVHNPDPDADIPEALFRMTQLVLDYAGRASGPCRRRGVRADRWLVLAPEAGAWDAPTLRQILSRVGIPNGFGKILRVQAGGRVEILAG